MSLLTSSTLHSVATALYSVLAVGHIAMGYQKVYPALAHIPTKKFEDRSGRMGAKNCWDLVTTVIILAGAMHWKWARTGASESIEETLAMLALSGHTVWNGIRFIRIGETPAGPLVVASSAIGGAAIASDLLSQNELRSI